jgi:hypothetical protein
MTRHLSGSAHSAVFLGVLVVRPAGAAAAAVSSGADAAVAGADPAVGADAAVVCSDRSSHAMMTVVMMTVVMMTMTMQMGHGGDDYLFMYLYASE